MIAYGISLGHWPDVGGPVHGTFNPQATSCYAEGLRIPPMPLMRATSGSSRSAICSALNIRLAGERMADLHAQIQATS